jgi:thiol-disulfide isomerase/thioredoxin
MVAAPVTVQAQSAAAITNAVLISEAGQPVWLSAFRGKVVFVNVWGSWCIPCLQEMPSIRGLQAQLGDRRGDVVFVFVSAKASQFQNDAAWLRQSGVAGANYRLESGSPGLSVPTTLILDPSGTIAQFRSSAVDWQIHADLIRSLLPHRARLASN